MACRECVNCGYIGNVFKCPECGSTNLMWDEQSFNESFEDWKAGEEEDCEREDSVSSVVELTENKSPEDVGHLQG